MYAEPETGIPCRLMKDINAAFKYLANGCKDYESRCYGHVLFLFAIVAIFGNNKYFRYKPLFGIERILFRG